MEGLKPAPTTVAAGALALPEDGAESGSVFVGMAVLVSGAEEGAGGSDGKRRWWLSVTLWRMA